MVTTHKIKTWSCSNEKCTYNQDFDPNDLQKMILHFPKIPLGKCPACWMGASHATDTTTLSKINSSMVLESDTSKQIQINIATDTEIDNLFDNVSAAKLKKMKTKPQLKKQAADDRKKFDSEEWKA